MDACWTFCMYFLIRTGGVFAKVSAQSVIFLPWMFHKLERSADVWRAWTLFNLSLDAQTFLCLKVFLDCLCIFVTTFKKNDVVVTRIKIWESRNKKCNWKKPKGLVNKFLIKEIENKIPTSTPNKKYRWTNIMIGINNNNNNNMWGSEVGRVWWSVLLMIGSFFVFLIL